VIRFLTRQGSGYHEDDGDANGRRNSPVPTLGVGW